MELRFQGGAQKSRTFFFADDSVMFMRASVEESLKIRSILQQYETASVYCGQIGSASDTKQLGSTIDSSTGPLVRPCNEGCREETISFVIDSELSLWQDDVLNELFAREEAAAILNIRLSLRRDRGFELRFLGSSLLSSSAGSLSIIDKLRPLNVPLIIKLFLWKANLNLLPCAENLCRHVVSVDARNWLQLVMTTTDTVTAMDVQAGFIGLGALMEKSALCLGSEPIVLRGIPASLEHLVLADCAAA
ncbi:conserved hypothetical protein [Ricinus communis]|uniref:Reverse transcriptase domain-containing protein n=1 Tax=Ricinus communis TaxID=3988 RepID=B9T071_RICCO|nr:conserved hypothetical protein [Ricinus communis]